MQISEKAASVTPSSQLLCPHLLLEFCPWLWSALWLAAQHSMPFSGLGDYLLFNEHIVLALTRMLVWLQLQSLLTSAIPPCVTFLAVTVLVKPSSSMLKGYFVFFFFNLMFMNYQQFSSAKILLFLHVTVVLVLELE